MAKPTDYPDYATDANYTSGPHTGTPTKVELQTVDVEQGNIAGVPPDARKFNWWQNLVGAWVNWLDEQWPTVDGDAGDILTTDGAGNHTWETSPAAATNSNAGTGTGELVKAKVGSDTPIKTLAKASGDLIAIANGTNEVTFSIPNVLIGTGDPNGTLAGDLGNVFIRTDVPTIYQNNDGDTAWAPVGGAGAGDPYASVPEISTAATGAVGISSEYAPGDHRHQVSTAAPVSIGSANVEGDSNALARANHGHNHDDQPGGSLHAVATPSASEVGGTAGFQSAIDKEKVDALVIDGDGLDFLANDGTYKTIEGGESGITTLTVWSPGITDAPPYYGTLATALAAVKSQPGPGVILLHPTTASAFATVASTTYDFDSRVSLYSINNRTLTFGDSAPIINAAEVGCLQDGFELTLDDGGLATGTRLLEISSNLLRPHIFNLQKSGTDRRLVQFTGGTPAAERGITIGRNVTTAMAGDIYSDGKTAVTLRGHGQSFVAGVVQNSSAHGNNLEVIYEDAQDVADATMTSGWSTGAASSTYAQDHGHQTGLVDDDHAGYWWINGRSGDRTYYGSNSSGGELNIHSSGHPTKGPLNLFGSEIGVNAKKIVSLATCTAGTDAANKDYVDGFWNTAGVPGNKTYNGSSDSGGALTIRTTSHATLGQLTLLANLISVNSTRIINVTNPQFAQDAATKAYVDGFWNTAGVAGNQTYYGSQDSGGQLVIASTSHVTRGPLILDASFISANGKRIQSVATPTVGADAANKDYVDARTYGQVISTAGGTTGAVGSGRGTDGVWEKLSLPTASSHLLGGVTTGGVSNRLVAPATGTYKIRGSVTFTLTGTNGQDKVRDIRIAVSGTGDTDTERSISTSSSPILGRDSVDTEKTLSLTTSQYVELECHGSDSTGQTEASRMSLTMERLD